MESKLLSQVEFKFLRNSYPLNEKVLCYFNTQTGVHVPQVGDWVGLFKVGWKNTKEHKSRKYVSIEDIENARRANVDYGYVVFEQHEVPKDLEGYYQFVYVTKDETVRGASKPFQFEMEPKELRDELKEMKREMWNTLDRSYPSWKNVEEREMWRKVEEREREQQRERELRGIRECEREQQRERELRGIRECEREQQRERELREIRECEREQQRELRELRERQIREIEHEQQLKSKLRHDLNNNSKLVDVIETELQLEESPLTRSVWEKMSEDSIVNKLVHKYLSSLSGSKSSKKEEIVKKLEELSHSLKSRVSEINDLKRECEELKLVNSELSGKLTSGERKVETLERELERESRKRFEGETLPSMMERSGKHYSQVAGIESHESRELLREENERLREELRRLSVLYQTESAQYSTLKDRLMKIDETLLRQISKRLSSEKSLSELEETTLVEIKGLKKLIDELRSENEILKARIRSDERKPEVVLQYPVSSKSSSVIVKEKSTTHIPKVNSQPEYLSLIETTTTTTRPVSGASIETGYPSISVSTSIPEISSKLTVSGKVSTVPELLFLEQVKKQTEQMRGKSIEEQLLRRQVQQIEDQLRGKSSEEQWTKKMIEEQLKIKLDKVSGSKQSEKREREEILREMTTEKGVEVPSKYSSSVWVLSSQPQQQPQPTGLSSLPSAISEELRRQQQKQWLKQYEEQAKQQLKEQVTITQVSSICPVCGIAVPKELNQTEFELHVNSHFRD